jgi:hypothetical protein
VARAALEETLRIRQCELDEPRIRALSQLASMPPYARDMQRSKQMSKDALELARKLGKPAVLAEALRARLYALSGPDDIDALLATAQEMLALDGESTSWISITAHSACYGAAIHSGNLAAADLALAALGRAALRQRGPESVWFHDRLKTQREFLEGGFADAESAFAELQRKRFNISARLFRIPLALLAVERNGPEAAGAIWDLPTLITETSDMPAEYRAGLARVAAVAGHEALARAVLESLSDGDFGLVTKDIGYLNTLVNLALVALALGDRPRAERLYACLAPYPHHNTPNKLMYYEGSVSHYLALLAEFLDDRVRAGAHFEDARAMNEALGNRAQLARTYYEYARFLRSVAGSAKRAQHMKAEAMRLSSALGLRALEAKARAL